MPLANFMEKALKDQPLNFIISDKTIILSEKENKIDEPSIVEKLNEQPPVTRDCERSGRQTLTGINIVVKNTNRGVVTDASGKFTIEAEPGSLLLISSIGYNSKEMKITQHQTYLNISLAIATSPLDEVQIVAYGTTTKRFNTGNVSTVKSEDIEKQPVNNPLAALQGRVPGTIYNSKNRSSRWRIQYTN